MSSPKTRKFTSCTQPLGPRRQRRITRRGGDHGVLVPHRADARPGRRHHRVRTVLEGLLEHLDENGVRDLGGARRFRKQLPQPEGNGHAPGAAGA